MSNKRLSATEISRFLNERLQDRRAIRNSEVHDRPQKLAEDAVRAAFRQKLTAPRGRFVSHCHLLVRIDRQRAVCQYCGQSYPLTPSGDLDRGQLVQEALSRPLFGREGQCRL